MTTDLSETLRAELERLRHAYEDLRDEIAQLRGVELGQTRRRGVLSSAGTTAESLLKFMYRREGRERGGKPADKLMLEELVTTLRDVLPEHIQAPLRAVQVYRNLGAHDKGDIRHVAESAIQTVDTALSQVVVWFFQEYLGGEFADLAEPRPAALRVTSQSEDEKAGDSVGPAAQGDEAAIAAWRELYWWAMRGGELKLLDDKALKSLAQKGGLGDGDLAPVRAAWHRDVAAFDEVLAQALEDGHLEDYEVEALEQTRLDACISAREATERTAPRLAEVVSLPNGPPAWLVCAHARARGHADAERLARDEAEASQRADAELRARGGPDALHQAARMARMRVEARAEAETELRGRLEAELRARQASEARARAEVERRARAEARVRAEASAMSWKRPWMEKNGEDVFGRWAMAVVAGSEVRFRYCAPGRFLRGSPPSEEGAHRYGSHDETLHPVELTRGFWMAETPVTQALWQVVTGKDPSYFKGANRPVEKVSWEDCERFFVKVNRNHKGLELRFPTEAEWEYACRAGSAGPRYGESDQIAWYGRNASETQPVGRKQPNAWGLFDTLGNVWEWVRDWKADYPRGTVKDPQGPPTGLYRVARGGCDYSDHGSLRAGSRHVDSPARCNSGIGFRVSRSDS
jgi:sulfatase modifying factor 1